MGIFMRKTGMAGISLSVEGNKIQLSFQKDDQATAVLMDAGAARTLASALNQLLDALQLLAAVFAVAIGLLAFEVCFQIVGPLTRDAQGHFNSWLHLSVHYPGV